MDLNVFAFDYTRISITCTYPEPDENVSHVFELGFKCFTNASRRTISSMVPFSVSIDFLCSTGFFLSVFLPSCFELNHSVLLFHCFKQTKCFEFRSIKNTHEKTKNNNNNNAQGRDRFLRISYVSSTKQKWNTRR